MAKVDLNKAKANLKAYARKEISKRELVQFRIDERNLEELLVLAEKSKQPLGTMVRDWGSRATFRRKPKQGRAETKALNNFDAKRITYGYGNLPC